MTSWTWSRVLEGVFRSDSKRYLTVLDFGGEGRILLDLAFAYK